MQSASGAGVSALSGRNAGSGSCRRTWPGGRIQGNPGIGGRSKYPVRFPGMLPQRELAEQFRQSDVFVLPSFFEGLALVNIEAMACGCKVVCSDIPGMRAWFSENVPGEAIAFVTLPAMENTDEPVAGELRGYEQRLAEALRKKLEQTEEEHPQLSRISWRKISENILKKCCGKTQDLEVER